MNVYIVQDENNEIAFVCSDPVETLEELERMGKETLMLTIWPVSDEKTTAKSPIDDARLKIIQTPAEVKHFTTGTPPAPETTVIS